VTIWSVLVCCHNSESRVTSTLRSICRQTVLSDQSIEVIVVDNASSDNTRQLVELFPFPKNLAVRIIFEPRLGLAYARQAAIEAATGKYLCFLDDDNDAHDSYLSVAQQVFEAHDDVCFCGGRSMWPDQVDISTIPPIAKFFSKSVAVGAQRGVAEAKLNPGEFLWGAGLCLRSAEAKELYMSGFDPVLVGRRGSQILSGEDGELTILLQLSGKCGYYTSALLLQHRVDFRRLNFAYFSRLFKGMGIAAAVLQIYAHGVRKVTSPTSKSCDMRSKEGSRLQRLSNTGFVERVYIILLYAVLGSCFFVGYSIAAKSELVRQAKQQLERITTRATWKKHE